MAKNHLAFACILGIAVAMCIDTVLKPSDLWEAAIQLFIALVAAALGRNVRQG